MFIVNFMQPDMIQIHFLDLCKIVILETRNHNYLIQNMSQNNFAQARTWATWCTGTYAHTTHAHTTVAKLPYNIQKKTLVR